ncbi:MAG TPA: toprim domain-containing protein [Candidatus Sulfotelmatobacter sp.]
MSSQWVDFAALKGSVDIEQVLDHYRVRLKRVRKDYLRGLCPLPTHGSEQSRESFGVDTGRNVWACHSASCCQARQGKVGGNILDLVACMEACPIREAALRLRTWSDTSRETGLPDQLVSKGKRAGLSQQELRRLPFTLRLRWHPYWEQRGIQRQTADWFGAGHYGGSGFLRGRMVFPIHDERGELVAYAGRTMDGREPRYLFPPGFRKSQVVFNLHRAVEFVARQGGVAIVVEGFFDCLKVHQAGYGNVVALMGTSMSDRQSELLDTYFRELVVMLDGDDAGRRASRVLAAQWPSAYLAWVPSGRQPDQLSSEEIEGILHRARGAPGA